MERADEDIDRVGHVACCVDRAAPKVDLLFGGDGVRAHLDASLQDVLLELIGKKCPAPTVLQLHKGANVSLQLRSGFTGDEIAHFFLPGFLP